MHLDRVTQAPEELMAASRAAARRAVADEAGSRTRVRMTRSGKVQYSSAKTPKHLAMLFSSSSPIHVLCLVACEVAIS